MILTNRRKEAGLCYLSQANAHDGRSSNKYRLYTCVADKSGVTLVELMIALVLSMLVMAAVYMAYQTQYKSSHMEYKVITMQQDLRAAMDMMEKDIRMAGCDPAMSSTAGIIPSGSSSSSIFVSMDLNGDGDTADADEQVTYSMNGTDLLRNSQIIATNVTTLGFTYLDDNNNSVSPSSGNVKSVVVTIVTRSDQPDPDTGKYITRTLTRRIYRRN